MFFLLILLHMTHGHLIEILESGQIYSPSKSIGTLLYINLFNHLPLSIEISGVVERCCTSLNDCLPVRLLGGDFGEWKSHENQSMIFLWPGLEWQSIENNSFCQVSLLFGSRNYITHVKLVNIKVNYLPLNIPRNNLQSRIYPKCNQFLNIRTNQCENLVQLREKFSVNSSSSSSSFLPFNHRSLPTKCIHGTPTNTCDCHENFISIPIIQRLYHPKTYTHQLCTHLLNEQYFDLDLLIILTSILLIFYLIILIISSIFICTCYRQIEEEEETNNTTFFPQSKPTIDQRFSVIEIASELQMNSS